MHLNLLFVESDKIVVKKREAKKKQIFSRGNFKKKTIHKNHSTKEEERPLRAAHKERERDEEDGGYLLSCD